MTLIISSSVSLFCGFCGFLMPLVGFTMRRPVPLEVLYRQMLVNGLNTMAIAFWMTFPILYWILVPKSRAALVWEENLRKADELFKREAAAGRGSWWGR